jgi:hypothetical protein
MLNADATAGCNHVVILHGEMTTAWFAAGFGYPRRSWTGIVRDHLRRERRVLRRLLPDAPNRDCAGAMARVKATLAALGASRP